MRSRRGRSPWRSLRDEDTGRPARRSWSHRTGRIRGAACPGCGVPDSVQRCQGATRSDPMSDMDDFNTQIIEEFRANGGVVGGPFEGATVVLLHHHRRQVRDSSGSTRWWPGWRGTTSTSSPPRPGTDRSRLVPQPGGRPVGDRRTRDRDLPGQGRGARGRGPGPGVWRPGRRVPQLRRVPGSRPTASSGCPPLRRLTDRPGSPTGRRRARHRWGMAEGADGPRCGRAHDHSRRGRGGASRRFCSPSTAQRAYEA